jgi:hypothetical protein
VRDALLLPSGELVVANRGTLDLLWFDADGTLARVVGGRGDGPGEFRYLFDLGSFTECLGGPWAESIIERSMLDATHLGARGTPTILINDLLLHGHPGERYLEAVVRDLLKER